LPVTDLILVIFVEEYKFLSSSLHRFIHPPLWLAACSFVILVLIVVSATCGGAPNFVRFGSETQDEV
jgi:hypothetical protein